MSLRTSVRCIAIAGSIAACGPAVEVPDETPSDTEATSNDDGSSTSTEESGAPTTTSMGDTEATSLDTSDPFAVCGDGRVEGDESCDDANPDPFDGCNEACRIPGELLWETTIPGIELTGLTIGLDAIYASAVTYDVDSDAPPTTHVVAWDGAGQELWSWSNMGHTGFDGAIAAKSGGGVFVSGADVEMDGSLGPLHLRALSGTGGIVWTTPLELQLRQPFALPDGGVTTADPLHDGYTLVLRLDANGTAVGPAPAMVPGDFYGMAVTPDGGFVLKAAGTADEVVLLDSDAEIVWTASEPDIADGWVRDDTLELVIGYESPMLVTYTLDGVRTGERKAPALELHAVPSGGYVAEDGDTFTRFDDELVQRWQIEDAWQTFLLDVDATRLVVGGPLPPPGLEKVSPIRIAVIAL